jgi:hypothetical protein
VAAPIDISVLRLLQQVNDFTERPPQEFPEETLKQIADLKASLTEYAPETESPGHRAAVEAAGQS